MTPAGGVALVEAVESSGKAYNLLENYPFSKENQYARKPLDTDKALEELRTWLLQA